jgi:hypothetical protein
MPLPRLLKGSSGPCGLTETIRIHGPVRLCPKPKPVGTSEPMTSKQRLAAIAEHAEHVFQALEADRETGSHLRNNAASAAWSKENRFLQAWLEVLLKHTRASPARRVYGSGNAVRAINRAVGVSTWAELHRIFQAAVDPEAELVIDEHGNQHIESDIVPQEE